MNRFRAYELPIRGLKLIEWTVFEDSRGRFEKLFCGVTFKEFGFVREVMQINRSISKVKGTIRGMHYQKPPFTEAKIVMCLKGAIWDVAVDIREGSETFLKWFSVELSGDLPRAFFIPEGFAHGFQTLTDDVEMLYIHSAPYVPEYEGGLNPFDPKLSILWPLEVTVVSERDKSFSLLEDTFRGIKV